ncbi:nitroreductase [Cellvibrio sp. PSBB023]|uniref:nitroreductase family protein n=1 Tax=Cellvibrio sp. PSBB023 TaxID=1945512 RepID=UPI00098FCEA4|nr:nitroreductase [Cellvibrio sp. PSBB023]AQT59035.1 nitroreductase [Cellvibrio sp. PSBB023]
MDAITALHQRVSQSKLQAPAPDAQQLATLIRAATRAADHGNLQPWRFLTIEGDGLEKLGQLFANVAAAKKTDISQAELDRFKSMPLRAPMIIVAIAKCHAHPKVPQIEQLIAAGAAAQNIINASFALGLGAIWRTGDMAYDDTIKQALGLISNETLDEQIVGFIYIGTPANSASLPREINPQDFFTAWTNE